MYVFLDTSIFEKNNFLEGHVIRQLLRLSEEGAITVVLTRITVNEIISRFRKNVKQNIEAYNTLRNKARVFRNLPDSSGVFEPIEEEKLVADFTELLNQQVRQAKCTVLEYPLVDVGKVFDKYFALEPPFGAGQKKDEFPDAFALLTLEEWCAQGGHVCHVISTDRDMQNYQSSHLHLIEDYAEFLDQKIRQVEANKAIIAKTLRFFELHKQQIKAEVGKWLADSLDMETRYNAPGQHLTLGILDVRSQEVVSIDSPKIIGVYSTHVELEAQAHLTYDILASIPVDGMLTRKGEYIHVTTKDMPINEYQFVPVVVDVNFGPTGTLGDCFDLEVVEINRGNYLSLTGGQLSALYPHHRGIRGYRPDLW